MRKIFAIFIIIIFCSMIIHGQNTISQQYDANKRLSSVTYPNGSVIRYTYNEIGNRITYVIINENLDVDLKITDQLTTPSLTQAGNNINIQFKVHNDGISNAGGHFTRIYLSELENQIGTEIKSVFHNGILADSLVDVNETVTIPANIPAGTYFVVIVADADSLVEETDEENNIVSIPISIIDATNLYILAINELQLSEPAVNPGESFDMNATIDNSGDIIADTIYLQAYLSYNQSFEEYLDVVLPNTFQKMNPLEPGEQLNYSKTTSISSNTIIGDYYVLLVLSTYQEQILTPNDVAVAYLSVGQQQFVLQRRTLQPGWNYVSFNVSPEDKNMESVFATISGALDEVKTPFATFLPLYDNVFSTMNAISNGEGYLVNVDQESTLELQGELIDRTISKIKLSEGWNLVAFYGNEAIAVDTALQSISDYLIQVKGQSGEYYHNDPGATNTLTLMLPGYGYFVKVNADVELIYNY